MHRNENLLAKRINTSEICSSYDQLCKRLLANKQILAWILKGCVAEFAECSLQDIAEKYIEGRPGITAVPIYPDECSEFIEGAVTEDLTMMEGNVSFDIHFRAIKPDSDTSVILIFNIEAQKDFYPGYPLIKRGVYYGSRLISSQCGTVFSNSHYEKINKVYSIWVCTNPPRYRRNTIVSYSLEQHDLIGKTKEEKRNYDLITVVMICLGNSDDKNYKGLLKMLDVLLKKGMPAAEKKRILQEDFSIILSTNMEREVSQMCDLGIGLWKEAWDEAWDEAKYEDVCNMMEATGWDLEKCMDILKVPEKKKNIYSMKAVTQKKELVLN